MDREYKVPKDSRVGRYRRAYEYYTESCKRADEKPIPFWIYMQRMPEREVDEMIRVYSL